VILRPPLCPPRLARRFDAPCPPGQGARGRGDCKGGAEGWSAQCVSPVLSWTRASARANPLWGILIIDVIAIGARYAVTPRHRRPCYCLASVPASPGPGTHRVTAGQAQPRTCNVTCYMSPIDRLKPCRRSLRSSNFLSLDRNPLHSSARLDSRPPLTANTDDTSHSKSCPEHPPQDARCAYRKPFEMVNEMIYDVKSIYAGAALFSLRSL
jgi:hypothetical protein